MSLEKQFPTAIKVNKDSALIHDSETKTDGLTTDYLSTWRTKCPSSKVSDLRKITPGTLLCGTMISSIKRL